MIKTDYEKQNEITVVQMPKRYCLVPFDHCPLRHTVLGPEFESTHEIRRLREKSIYLYYNT